MLDTQGLSDLQNPACPQSCPNCRQAGAVQDNARQDGDDGNAERRDAAKGNGKSLLKVIRLLVEMAPKERSALLGLLKALG